MTQIGDIPVPPTPKGVSIAITGKCNLSCQYCFYADEMNALNDLKTEQWLHFFDRLGQLSVMNITLTGGEAFTRPDLFEIIDGIINNRMRYSILSNGTLLNEKTITNLLESRRRKRLDSIQISIDGSNAEIHNKSRPNSFDPAVEGLRLLKAAEIPIAVRATINKHNYRDLENMTSFLLEELEMNSFSTNEAAPMGVGCHNKMTTVLSAKEQLSTMNSIKKLQNKYPGRLIAQAGPQAKMKMYAQMEKARETGEKPANWLMGYLSACGCVYSRIDILHDGTIVPCHMLSTVKLGNILQDDLKSIWQSHPTLADLRRRRFKSMSEVEACRDCEWHPFCNGGCPGLALQTTGDLFGANIQDCYRLFLADTKGIHVH